MFRNSRTMEDRLRVLKGRWLLGKQVKRTDGWRKDQFEVLRQEEQWIDKTCSSDSRAFFSICRKGRGTSGSAPAEDRSILAIGSRVRDHSRVETLTINLEDEVARRAKESARREHKSISEWIAERITFDADRAGALAELEARAAANGYPAGWLGLYGSLADDSTFAAPARSATRPLEDAHGE